MTSVGGPIVVCVVTSLAAHRSNNAITERHRPSSRPLYIPCPLRPPVSPNDPLPRIVTAELHSRVLTHAYIAYTSHSFDLTNDAPLVETLRVASSSSQSNQQECLLVYSLTIVYRHSFNSPVRPRIEGDEGNDRSLHPRRMELELSCDELLLDRVDSVTPALI